MDITSVIADLRSQRDDICKAILALERVSFSQTKTRGRPRRGHHAKATTIQDGVRLALAAGAASDVEQAFDTHWQYYPKR